MASPTSIELTLYQILDSLGINYLPQYALTEAKTIPDAYIPSLGIAIYADGTYWHSFPKVIAKDKRVNSELIKLGYKVIRLAEPDLRKNPLQTISKALGKYLNHHIEDE